MKKIFRLSFLLIALPFLSHAQTSNDRAAAVKNLIDSRNYVFLAQTAIPQGQSERRIETDFSMTVGKDTIVVDLPYFGGNTSAPMDDSQNPLQFNTVKFSYTVTPGKKDGWRILIKPKDSKIAQLSLTVLSNGYASLQVNGPSLDPISFNGSVASPSSAK